MKKNGKITTNAVFDYYLKCFAHTLIAFAACKSANSKPQKILPFTIKGRDFTSFFSKLRFQPAKLPSVLYRAALRKVDIC